MWRKTGEKDAVCIPGFDDSKHKIYWNLRKDCREKVTYVNLYSEDAEKPRKFVKKSLDMQKQLRYNAIV